MMEQLYATARVASRKMPEDMTEGEKCAIAFAAGCAITTEIVDEGGRLMMRVRTKNPVGIVHDGRKLMVAERVDR